MKVEFWLLVRMVLLSFGMLTRVSYCINKVIWSKDESRILTANEDGTVQLWDATTGKELLTFNDAHDPTWNKDESRILTAGRDGTVRLWDATTGKLLVTFNGHANF